MIAAPVIALPPLRGPHAIGRPVVGLTFLALAAGVVAVVVLPLDGVSLPRSFPHVSQKGRVVVTPAPTDLDAATSVTRIAIDLGVATAANHPGPDVVFRLQRAPVF